LLQYDCPGPDVVVIGLAGPDVVVIGSAIVLFSILQDSKVVFTTTKNAPFWQDFATGTDVSL
jgi:hypothetical protein